jgi:glycosyltransferase involved in cell wall biosynthesis
LHRSEGFGLTMAEAMALGKPVIATGYSGNLDYMSSENSFLVPHGFVQVGHGNEPYPPSTVWAEPDIEAASQIMRRVFEEPENSVVRGSVARRDLPVLHGPYARSRWIVGRLREIRNGMDNPDSRSSSWLPAIPSLRKTV